MESKKMSNDQELIQSDSTSCPQNQTEIIKYVNWQQFTIGSRDKPNGSSFPDRWSFSYLKYVTSIIVEPKYKYGQQEQVTVRNHNRSTALEWSDLDADRTVP